MNSLREAIRWAWLVVCIADCLASFLSWLELKSRRERTFLYMGRVMFADAFRAFTSVIGLYLFGINVQAHLWYVALGLFSVLLQGGATVGFLLYWRGLINGEGFFGLVKRLVFQHRRTK